MNDIEFRTMLRATLEDFDKRLSAIEHSVNDVIIGSLESAASEYADSEAFEAFKENYGGRIAPLVSPYKKLFGEDYDLERGLYDDLKATEGYGSEGFDEAGVMAARLDDLEARINSIKEDVAEIKEETEEQDGSEDVSISEIPEEQLQKELEEAMTEGVV